MQQSLYQHRLALLDGATHRHLLHGSLRGIEREGLRVTQTGQLAATPHPDALGKALTHPHITTDYSEALLELITAAYGTVTETLHGLDELHRYTLQALDNEWLWAGSMPCRLPDDAHIPVARYGHSLLGQLKSVYRQGLGHRYGRAMQTIAGLHYNLSLPPALWALLAPDNTGAQQALQQVQSEGYLALIRNVTRYAWLLLYLFGASPAVSNSFFQGSADTLGLQRLDQDTLFLPYATSLRMSDIGYTNRTQASLAISYNSLNDYIDSLWRATHTPYAPYVDLGVQKAGRYQQLNSHLLQIENEYYSVVRPKRTTRSGEKPLTALRRRGVEYVEVRCLDINPFEPLGISDDDAHFLELFLWYCALQDSSAITRAEQQHIKANVNNTVLQGRAPDLTLHNGEQSVPLVVWGQQLLADMQPLAEHLDSGLPETPYGHSLALQQAKIADASVTPSAKIVRALEQQRLSYTAFILQQSYAHGRYLTDPPLAEDRQGYFARLADRSRYDQQAMEQADDRDFDRFLQHYQATE